MPFAQGARSGLSLIPETVNGTTPATGNMLRIPFVSNTLGLTKEEIQSQALMPDRMMRNSRHGNRQVGGDIAVELGPVDFDPLLESAFMSTFTANVLKIGTTLRTLSIEDDPQDIAAFRMFRGVAVNTMTMTVAPNQMVGTTFNVVGQDVAVTAVSSKPTKTNAAGHAPFDSCSGAISIGNAGGTLTPIAAITSIELSINNDITPAFVVGSCAAAGTEFGMATVTGTISAYFEDLTIYNRFLNETETALSFTLNNAANNRPYTFLLPRVKFNSGDIPVSGPKSRIMSIGFTAIYDTATNTSLQVTRVVPA